MNEAHERPGEPFEGLAPTRAPVDLRARVLAASRAALLAGRSRPDRWTRLWESRPLRLAWAASVLLLLAGHAILVRPSPPPAASAAAPLARGATDADAELAGIGRLPRIDPEARSLRSDPEGSTPSSPSSPHEPPKENRT